MAKLNISGTLESSVIDRINKVAEKQVRSFSNSLEYLVLRGLSLVEAEIQQSEEQSKTEK